MRLAPDSGSIGARARAQGALASVSAAMSSADSVNSVARIRLSTCSTDVALAIGAVTPGLAMVQASATSAGLALLRDATASSASRMRNPLG